MHRHKRSTVSSLNQNSESTSADTQTEVVPGLGVTDIVEICNRDARRFKKDLRKRGFKTVDEFFDYCYKESLQRLASHDSFLDLSRCVHKFK